MEMEKWFDETLKSYEEDFEFRFETFILHLTEQICKKMEAKGIKKSQLAQILEVSPAAVTKILNGNSNFKLRTLLKLANALKSELKINFEEHAAFGPEVSLTSANEELVMKEHKGTVVFIEPKTSDMLSFRGVLESADATCMNTNAQLPPPYMIEKGKNIKRIQQA